MSQPLLILIDGFSLAFRAYFAFAKGRDGGLRTSTGIPTSVTYGFMKTLLDVIDAEQPTYVAIAFDSKEEKTFRHEKDETYKAGRPEPPEDFGPDVENLQSLLATLRIPTMVCPGYEADDIIGTVARRANAEGVKVKVLSGDRDLFQLVDDTSMTTILYLTTTFGKGTPPPKEFGPVQVREKMGITPAQVVDFKALCGDSSDNIPGVRGIGEKTAVQLLTTYGTLENVYASLGEMKGAVKKKLEEGHESAMHSQWMAQIHLDVPVQFDISTLGLNGYDESEVTTAIERLELRSFVERIKKLQPGYVPSAKDKKPAPVKVNEDGDTWFFSAEDTANQKPEATVGIQPRVIDTPEKLQELMVILQGWTDRDRPIAWDTETTALEPRDAQLVGIGCCWGTELSEMAYIPVGHRQGTQLERSMVLETLRPVLESDAHPKVLHNAKYDRLIFRVHGINLAGVVMDTMLASYVLSPDGKHGLKDLSASLLGIYAKSFSDMVAKGETIADLNIAAAAEYCGMDVHTTRLLASHFRDKLSAIPPLKALLLDVEQPLEPVLAEMEFTGIRIDQDYLKEFSKQLESDLSAIEKKAYELAGTTFNLSSPKQLSELLAEKVEVFTQKARKTKTGYSTDAATLEKLQGDHPIIDSIVEYRTLSKLKSTYVDALPKMVRSDTQRVHTDFNQTGTTTGRLSSSDPNLQNIPIRTAFSRQIRKAFIPQSGWKLVSADYSQIELRILAHLSQEKVLIEAYHNNEDVHSLTAKLLLDKEDVTSDERRLGKIINFGVVYGMGAQRFGREAGVSNAEASDFIKKFNDRYSKVFQYLEQMKRNAIANGYVETILGRRRYFTFGSDSLVRWRGADPSAIDLSKLKTRDQYDAQSLRAAANAPIQGSSADIIKIAMCKIHELLKNYQARLLLQVHDELIFEMPIEEWAELETTIRSTMESAVNLSVPLLVEIHAGDNWMEAK